MNPFEIKFRFDGKFLHVSYGDGSDAAEPQVIESEQDLLDTIQSFVEDELHADRDNIKSAPVLTAKAGMQETCAACGKNISEGDQYVIDPETNRVFCANCANCGKEN